MTSYNVMVRRNGLNVNASVFARSHAEAAQRASRYGLVLAVNGLTYVPFVGV
jgi:hypothetical protein